MFFKREFIRHLTIIHRTKILFLPIQIKLYKYLIWYTYFYVFCVIQFIFMLFKSKISYYTDFNSISISLNNYYKYQLGNCASNKPFIILLFGFENNIVYYIVYKYDATFYEIMMTLNFLGIISSVNNALHVYLNLLTIYY